MIKEKIAQILKLIDDMSPEEFVSLLDKPEVGATVRDSVKHERFLDLFLLEQDENRGYDTYDSCIVAAYSHEDAATIHPCRIYPGDDARWGRRSDWANTPEEVRVTWIGVAGREIKRGVVLASFNAG